MWLIGLCGPTVLAYAWLADRALRTDTTTGPRGDVAFIQQPGASEMLARIVAMPSGETVFFYPVMPLLPFLAAREHISKYDIFTPGFTLPSQYQDACQSVMRTASWVVIDRNWTDPNMLSRAFPAMRDPQPRETKAFEEDLDRSFDFVAREGTFELRHRVEGTGVSICSGIDG